MSSESAAEAEARRPQGGGRLKFFKDGKFILELARGGEGAAWVAVPRKQQQPQRRRLSLSASDDNSSVQSSPCTREGRSGWKQAQPRRHLSRHLACCYVRPSHAPHLPNNRKRRRPFDDSSPAASYANGTSAHRPKRRRRLRSVVRMLAERPPRPQPPPTIVSAKTTLLTSPCKRRPDSQDADVKRAKPKQPNPPPTHAPKPGPSRLNGSPTPQRQPRPLSNYSINSLLSKSDACEEPHSSPAVSSASHPSDKYYYQGYRAPFFPHPAYLGAAYPAFAPRAPPPSFWLPYQMVHPGPWAPPPAPSLVDRLQLEDASPDLPLNLSKHRYDGASSVQP